MVQVKGKEGSGHGGRSGRFGCGPRRRARVGSRRHLCGLPGLFALFQFRSRLNNEQRVLRVAGWSILSLGPLRLLGIHSTGSGWFNARSMGSSTVGVDSQLRRLARGGPSFRSRPGVGVGIRHALPRRPTG
jgi:hypothetical protein